MMYTYTGQVAKVKKKHEKWHTTYYGSPVIVNVTPGMVIISELDEDTHEEVVTGIPMDELEWFEIVNDKNDVSEDEEEK